MSIPNRDCLRDNRDIEVTSALVQQMVGVPPAIQWRYDGTPRMLVESYLYIPSLGMTFPKLPMHMFSVLLDGKPVRNLLDANDINGNTDHHEQFTTLPNRCVLVPKDMASHWRPSSGSINMAAVYLTGPAQLALESLIHDSEQPVLLHDEFLVALTRQLLRAAIDSGHTPPDYAEHLVNTFTAQLEWHAAVNRVSTERRSTASDPAIIKALRLINEHLDESISIERLFDSVQMTSTLFRRRFHDVTGLPVHRYILMQRVERARELIDKTNLALSVVASQCGFSSQSHMTTVFSRELGMTPGELRRTKPTNSLGESELSG